MHQDREAVYAQLLVMENMEVVLLTPTIIRRAIELQGRYKIEFWDASIIATAEHAKCGVLYSEDLNAGQLYAGVRVENPLR